MRPRILFVPILLLGAVGIAYEIALTRVFSIAQWHHFAYMAISMAMLGFAISGTALGLARERIRGREAGLFRGVAEGAVSAGGRVFYFGADISPALFSVGYIVTLPIALQIFAGGVFGWLIAIPLLGTEGVSSTNPVDIAGELWSSRVRYLGVGAMIVGGVASIWNVRDGLAAAVKHVWAIARRQEEEDAVTERNLDGRIILAVVIACIVLVGGIYFSLLQSASLTLLTTISPEASKTPRCDFSSVPGASRCSTR